jgi:hypothetical protein
LEWCVLWDRTSGESLRLLCVRGARRDGAASRRQLADDESEREKAAGQLCGLCLEALLSRFLHNVCADN